jgi:hypothetical protein
VALRRARATPAAQQPVLFALREDHRLFLTEDKNAFHS